MAKLIDGANYFHQRALNEMKAELEKGEAIKVYIDCISHYQNNEEQEAYRAALLEEYGDRLEVEKHDGGFSYYYEYKLNQGRK